MTTKQVKKAYQKANKQPKISKAEQRRRELFEQDRIRKEFEKEKNQARARAARDKKKEREERERAEKKKKGLPLVDVRPSQDTIARFVRAKPVSRGDDSALSLSGHGEEGESRSPSPQPSPSPVHQRHDSTHPDQIRPFDETDKENVRPPDAIEGNRSPLHVACRDDRPGLGDLNQVEPPSKKRKVAVLEEEYEGDDALFLIANEVVSPSPNPNPKVDVASDHVEGTPGPGTTEGGLDVDDSFSVIDVGEENLLDELLRETESVHGALNASGSVISGQQQAQPAPAELPPSQPPENHVSSLKEPERLPPCEERTAREIEPSVLPRQAVLSSEPLLDTTKVSRQNPVPEKVMQVSTPPPFAVSPTSSVRRSQATGLGSRSFCRPRLPMAPPPILPKFKPSKQDSAGHPRTPQFLKPSPRSPRPPPRTPIVGPRHSRVTKPAQVPENNPLPSTQLFLLNHLDDFLPSPSQEVREIFEQPREEHGRNWSKATSRETHTHHKAFKPSLHIPKTLSTPYKRSVISASNIDSRRPCQTPQVARSPSPPKAAVLPTIQPIPQNTSSTFEMPFFSTQDLLLSSQDVKDIEEDPPPPPKARVLTPIPPKDCVEPPEVPRQSPKQLFTSTCRELRYKYAIERTRTAAWEGPVAMQRAREELDKLQALEDERLEALLANPGEGTDRKQDETLIAERSGATLDGATSGSPAARPRSTPTPRFQPPYSVCPNKSAQGSTPGSCAISAATTLHQARKPPDVQGSRPRTNNNETYQRSTRPKASYEAMLELLAKGPKQRSDARMKRVGQNPDRDGGRERHGNTNGNEIREEYGKSEHANMMNEITNEELEAMMTTVPASQETDYDGGEEWDVDDLLHGVL